mmetsp:Transcript_6291/g.10850  ORF Transcript_6291/g.10850 Transcript_6291/m.10850 type:complete len:130 (-) Transcript_6291:240-629(-)
MAVLSHTYVRAPELLFGCKSYTTQIDVWSAGCVFAELLLGFPIFPGDDPEDQTLKIIQILGAPSKTDFESVELGLPMLPSLSFASIFERPLPKDCLDLLRRMLMYDPDKRIALNDALNHMFLRESANCS